MHAATVWFAIVSSHEFGERQLSPQTCVDGQGTCALNKKFAQAVMWCLPKELPNNLPAPCLCHKLLGSSVKHILTCTRPQVQVLVKVLLLNALELKWSFSV